MQSSTFKNLDLLRDPKFYLEKLCRIKGKKPGQLIPFILKEHQKDLFNTIKNYCRIIILKARQLGTSTAVVGWIYHNTIMNPGTTSAIIGYNAQLAAELLDKIKTFYRSTPNELKPTIHYDSKWETSFPRIDSKILVLPSTESVGRGYTLSNVLATEVSLWENAEEKMITLEASVPITGKLIVESTPRGIANHFAKLWMDKENDYVKKKYGWWLGYTREEIEIIRRRINNPMKFAQEFECFPPDTSIITNNGIKNIQDIVPGDFVLSHSNRFRKVKKIMSRDYSGELIDMRFYGNNLGLQCTPEHPIRVCNDGVNNEWKKAELLTNNDRITFPRKLMGTRKIISEQMAMIIAWFICEGSYWKAIVDFALSSEEKDNIKELSDAIEFIVGRKPQLYQGTGKGIKLDIPDCELGEFLINHCGNGAHNKKIPFDLITGYEELFYNTLIKGDGCNACVKRFRKKDQFITVSRTLAYQMFILANSLGYRASISFKIKKDTHIKTVDRIVKGGPVYEVRIFKFNPYPNTKRYKLNKLRKHKYNISSKIKSAKRIDFIGKVYNLEVEIDNSYTANGVVVHNCAFLASGLAVFDNKKVEAHRKNILKVGDTVKDENESYKVVEDDGWRIYKKPKLNHFYVCGVDPADGVEGGDYSAAIILDRTTGEEVAFYHRRIPQYELAKKLNEIGRRYNNALMVVEMNSGSTTMLMLKELLYPNPYFRQSKMETLGQTVTDRLGWRTTNINRGNLINDFDRVFRENSITIHSEELLNEMLAFVYDKNGDPNAEGGFHDDIIFAVSVAIQGFKILHDRPLDQISYEKYLPTSFAY